MFILIMICLSLSGCGKLFHSTKKVPNTIQIEEKVNSDKKLTEDTTVANNEVSNKQDLNSIKTIKNGSKDTDEEMLKKEKENIVNIFKKYIAEINNQNILNTMNCLDPYRKDYEEKRVFFNMIFNEFNIQYVINDFNITSIDTNIATIDANMHVTNDVAKDIKGKIHLRKVKGLWRISAENIF